MPSRIVLSDLNCTFSLALPHIPNTSLRMVPLSCLTRLLKTLKQKLEFLFFQLFTKISSILLKRLVRHESYQGWGCLGESFFKIRGIFLQTSIGISRSCWAAGLSLANLKENFCGGKNLLIWVLSFGGIKEERAKFLWDVSLLIRYKCYHLSSVMFYV